MTQLLLPVIYRNRHLSNEDLVPLFSESCHAAGIDQRWDTRRVKNFKSHYNRDAQKAGRPSWQEWEP